MTPTPDDRARPGRSAAWRLLGSVLSGAMLWLAFPPTGLWPLGVVSVTLLCLAVHGARPWAALGLGLVQGLVSFGLLIWWMTVVGVDAWALLVVYCALWIAMVGLGTALTGGLPLWPVWVAATWVGSEALRDRIPLGGFPWGRLAYAQSDSALTAYASLGGAPLVTFMVALAGSLIAAAVISHEDLRRAIAATVGAVAIVLLGALIPLPHAGEGTPSSAVVAVVQGNVPTTGLSIHDDRREVLHNHVRETIQLAAAVAAGTQPQPQFVVWPENSTDIDPLADVSAAEQISTAARAIGAPILVGAVVDDPVATERVMNVGIVWDPVTGPGETYVKTHPVPFGEYVPFRAFLTGLIGRFEMVPRDFSAGAEPGVLQLGGVVAGDVICFEVAYDEVVRAVVTGGAQVIVVQTNNATYAGTGQPAQQMAISRLRSVEHARSVLVASTSGISAIVEPDGAIESELPELVGGSLVAEVPLRTSLTVSDRLGDLPELAVSILAGLAAVLGWWSGRRRRRGLTLWSEAPAAGTLAAVDKVRATEEGPT